MTYLVSWIGTQNGEWETGNTNVSDVNKINAESIRDIKATLQIRYDLDNFPSIFNLIKLDEEDEDDKITD